MQLLLALGTNLGDREENIRQACRLLQAEVGPLLGLAPLFRTAPVGFESDNVFFNTVALFQTSRTAEELLDLTQEIERRMGRTQKSVAGRHFDRTIDIDLLWLEGVEPIDSNRLTLPHPHLHERAFVLDPLMELLPEWKHPLTGLTPAAMRHKLGCEGVYPASSVDLRPEVVGRINELLGQLSASAPTIDLEGLRSLIESESTRLYLLYDEKNRLQGMATLIVCLMPTGRKGWVEDVVVDREARGRGYGHLLMKTLIRKARRLELSSLNLTSKPTRAAAHRLYESLGFVKRATDVFRLSF